MVEPKHWDFFLYLKNQFLSELTISSLRNQFFSELKISPL